MSRRDRIRAALIYRRWAIITQMRWLPPHGWVTKAAALGAHIRQGRFSSAMGAAYGGQQISRDTATDIYAEFAKSFFETTISWRESDAVLPRIDPTRYKK